MSGVRYPALAVDTHRWIQLLKDDSQLKNWTYAGLKNYRKKQKKIYILDSNDSYWRITNIHPDRPLTGLCLLLANTIFNPRISVEYQAEAIAGNANVEFFQTLRMNLEKADDVFTQYSEIEGIIATINANQSFNELTNALKNTGAI